MIDPKTGEIIEVPAVRTRFNYDRNAVSRATATSMRGQVTRTQQSMQDECDINTIVRRFGLTGQLPDNARAPQYIDFEGVFDFQTAMNAVLEAERAFMDFPAETRKFFDNDPQQMLQFVSDTNNRDKAIELGLIPKPPVAPPEPPPMKVRVVPDEPAKPA